MEEISLLIPIISVLILFIAIMIIFSNEKLDYVSYALVGALLACIITKQYFQEIKFEDFIAMIEFKPIFFIFGMQIIVMIAEKENGRRQKSAADLRYRKYPHGPDHWT